MSARKYPAPLRCRIVNVWFLIDAVVALAPPLYWAVDGKTFLILGIPAALFYFLAVCACITASLVVAYFIEPATAEVAA